MVRSDAIAIASESAHEANRQPWAHPFLDTSFAVALLIDPKITATGKVREIAPEADAATLTRRTMAFFIMLQLQSSQKPLLVVGVAPLGLIGVVAALVPSGKPMGSAGRRPDRYAPRSHPRSLCARREQPAAP